MFLLSLICFCLFADLMNLLRSCVVSNCGNACVVGFFRACYGLYFYNVSKEYHCLICRPVNIPVPCFAFFASANLSLRVKSVGKKCFQNIGNPSWMSYFRHNVFLDVVVSPICPRSLVHHRSTVPGCPGAPLPMALHTAALCFFGKRTALDADAQQVPSTIARMRSGSTSAQRTHQRAQNCLLLLLLPYSSPLSSSILHCQR